MDKDTKCENTMFNAAFDEFLIPKFQYVIYSFEILQSRKIVPDIKEKSSFRKQKVLIFAEIRDDPGKKEKEIDS